MPPIQSQSRLAPVLPQVVGNADYAHTEQLLVRIDDLLVSSGVEAEFVRQQVEAIERDHVLMPYRISARTMIGTTVIEASEFKVEEK